MEAEGIEPSSRIRTPAAYYVHIPPIVFTAATATEGIRCGYSPESPARAGDPHAQRVRNLTRQSADNFRQVASTFY